MAGKAGRVTHVMSGIVQSTSLYVAVIAIIATPRIAAKTTGNTFAPERERDFDCVVIRISLLLSHPTARLQCAWQVSWLAGRGATPFLPYPKASGLFGVRSPHTVAGAASAPDARNGSVLSKFPVRFPALCAERKTKLRHNGAFSAIRKAGISNLLHSE